jgi:transposase
MAYWVTRGVGSDGCAQRLPAIGYSPHTLLEWVKKADRDSGRSPGVPSDVAAKLKTLERENRELRQANEILRKASAYFAQAELDRRFKL